MHQLMTPLSASAVGRTAHVPSAARRASDKRKSNASAESLAAVAAIMLLLICTVLGSLPHRHAVAQTTVVSAQPGDSLWSIATRYPVEGLSTSQTVRLLADINPGAGDTLRHGDQLRIPAPDTGSQYALR